MSTLSLTSARLRTWVSALLVALLATAGLVVAAPAAAAPAATLSVSKSTGLNPDGETITVTGAGYTIDPAGIYAQVGWIKADAWTPISAEETRAENRVGVKQAWVGSGVPGQPAWTVAEDGTGSFTWTVTVTKAELDAKKVEGYTLAVFTLGAHGNFIQPDNERYVALSFAVPAPEPATAELSVSKTTDLNPEGEAITVTGSGYTIDPAGIYAQVGWIKADAWTPISAEETRAENRVRVAQAWVGSGFPGQPAWTVAEDGTGSFTWTVTVTQAELDAKKVDGYTLAVFTLGAHGNFMQPANERYVPITFVEPAPEPVGAELTVSKTTDLDPAGETITVSGTGYAIDPAGIYAQVGWIKADAWTPISAEETRAENRVRVAQAWVGSGFPGQPAWTVAEDGTGSFTWTVEVTKAELDAKKVDGYTLAVFTLGAHGNFMQPANERYVPITFAEPAPEPAGAQLAVSKTTDLNPVGEAITVTGSGYTIDPAGIYAQIGWIKADAWTPVSRDDTRAENRIGFQQAWIGSGFPGQPAWTVVEDGTGSFTWTVEVTKAEADAKAVAGYTLAVFTLGAHGNFVQPDNERYVPISFAAGAVDPGTPTTPVTSTPPVVTPETPPAAIAAGSLTWGIKQSFRDYVLGPIAHGLITATGVGSSGGAYVFGQGSSNFDAAAGVGTSNYTGTVRFSGHNGALDLRLSDPIVRIDSATSGTLMLSINGGGHVAFATLSLGAGNKSTSNGSVSYSGVPATLTAAGANAFRLGESQFYQAGAALDPVSFTIGSPKAAATGTRTVATSVATPTVPATPPATTGITLVGAPADGFTPGSEVTITADGFQPDEQNIKVIIYSEPIVLAEDVAADAAGTVTWTGVLPDGLTGTHTLTLQGSVSRGIELTINEVMRTMTTDGCEVQTASISWGFYEAFRSYLSSAIAHGEWEVADGATYETPDFGWADGTGTYETGSEEGMIQFAGSVRFTGHGGILDTTIANPQVRFDGDGTAVLLLDVSGTTRDGEAVSEPGVEFATIDLTEADESGDGITFTDAAVTLTPAGSAAFGTYEAGTELDPITITVVPSECELAATSTPAQEDDGEAVAATGTSPAWWVWALIAAGVLILAAVITWLIVRRRNTGEVTA